jgi:hypothetical protein
MNPEPPKTVASLPFPAMSHLDFLRGLHGSDVYRAEAAV